MFNHIDLILAIPLAIGAVKGFTKGFILELASLAGLVGGVYLAVIGANASAEFLSTHIDWNVHLIKITTFILVFVLVIVVVHIIATFLGKVAKMAGLGLFNRIAGIAAGIVKTAFILSAAIILFNYVNHERALMSVETQENSFLYDKIALVVPAIVPGGNFLKPGAPGQEEP